MELRKPKAILLDWDNTLVDTWPVIHEALAYCFTQMGKEPWTLAEVKVNVQQSMRDYFPKLFGEDRWQEAANHYMDGYLRVHCERLVPIDGAEDTIKLIQDYGIYQAVVSNKKGRTLRIEADYLGWTPYFQALIGAGDAKNDKPHVDHAYMALPQHGDVSLSKDVWFIGDSAIDMQMAENAGLTPIFYGTAQKAETIEYPISAIVESQLELQQLLKLSL